VSRYTAPIRRVDTAKGHYYRDATGQRVPGVTTIIGDGVPKPALINWAANAAAEAGPALEPEPTPEPAVERQARTARRSPAPPAEPELEPDPDDGQGTADDQAPDLEPTQPTQAAKPGGRPITPKLRSEIHALCNQAGFDRDAKLRFASEVCGREITTTNDLAMIEAARFASALDRYLAQQEPPEADGRR
jgi:hypothetical protein